MAERFRPAWVTDDEPMPDPSRHDPLENFVAGAISTTPPFAAHHPAWALPAAVKALAALAEWEPDASGAARETIAAWLRAVAERLDSHG